MSALELSGLAFAPGALQTIMRNGDPEREEASCALWAERRVGAAARSADPKTAMPHEAMVEGEQISQEEAESNGWITAHRKRNADKPASRTRRARQGTVEPALAPETPAN
ncbi:hypothetical protein HPB52_019816 [Rhipicephalus sanguineus]|uniref:Uncharacterized protein n=1 Tax=Rhipicephalus sanguineus TaxID=34632 RepID=A0A9D4QE97_RHISA|nr:hypothetical protein HPB52_019816 [Rhipicephalus sanguineus]